MCYACLVPPTVFRALLLVVPAPVHKDSMDSHVKERHGATQPCGNGLWAQAQAVGAAATMAALALQSYACDQEAS